MYFPTAENCYFFLGTLGSLAFPAHGNLALRGYKKIGVAASDGAVAHGGGTY